MREIVASPTTKADNVSFQHFQIPPCMEANNRIYTYVLVLKFSTVSVEWWTRQFHHELLPKTRRNPRDRRDWRHRNGIENGIGFEFCCFFDSFSFCVSIQVPLSPKIRFSDSSEENTVTTRWSFEKNCVEHELPFTFHSSSQFGSGSDRLQLIPGQPTDRQGQTKEWSGVKSLCLLCTRHNWNCALMC